MFGGLDPATARRVTAQRALIPPLPSRVPQFPYTGGGQAQLDGVAATPEKASFCAQSQNPETMEVKPQFMHAGAWTLRLRAG